MMLRKTRRKSASSPRAKRYLPALTTAIIRDDVNSAQSSNDKTFCSYFPLQTSLQALLPADNLLRRDWQFALPSRLSQTVLMMWDVMMWCVKLWVCLEVHDETRGKWRSNLLVLYDRDWRIRCFNNWKICRVECEGYALCSTYLSETDLNMEIPGTVGRLFWVLLCTAKTLLCKSRLLILLNIVIRNLKQLVSPHYVWVWHWILVLVFLETHYIIFYPTLTSIATRLITASCTVDFLFIFFLIHSSRGLNTELLIAIAK